jgi:hypothetical protein
VPVNGCGLTLTYVDNKLKADLTVGQCNSVAEVKILEFETIDVEQITCEDGKVKSQIISVAVLKGTQAAEIEAYRARAEMLKAQCLLEPIAAIPEWWQLRPESHRPQLIIQFGEVRADGSIGKAMYPLTIPHFIGTKEDAKKINFKWRKGSIEGILTLKDNSKLIVNAVSKEEANRIIALTTAYIKDTQLTGSFSKIGERKGQPFKQIIVAPKVARFFAEGAKSTSPTWVVRLDEQN